MSGLPTPTAQNVRLIVIVALSMLALVTTMANAADDASVADRVPAPSSVPPSGNSLPSLGSDALPTDPAATSDRGAPSTSSSPPQGIGIVSIPSDVDDLAVESTPPPSEAVESACDLPVAEQQADRQEDDGGVSAADFILEDTFGGPADEWEPLSGSWSVDDGAYRQADSSGYDLITQLRVEPPAEFRISVSLQALSEMLGGGVILAQPRPSDRSGATVVDFTDGGSFLRWGRYDDATGQYQYVGGVPMAESFDPAARHDLTIEVRRERTTVFVDGVDVGDFEAVGSGRIGLVTSRSAVAFDDLILVDVKR